MVTFIHDPNGDSGEVETLYVDLLLGLIGELADQARAAGIAGAVVGVAGEVSDGDITAKDVAQFAVGALAGAAATAVVAPLVAAAGATATAVTAGVTVVVTVGKLTVDGFNVLLDQLDEAFFDVPPTNGRIVEVSPIGTVVTDSSWQRRDGPDGITIDILWGDTGWQRSALILNSEDEFLDFIVWAETGWTVPWGAFNTWRSVAFDPIASEIWPASEPGTQQNGPSSAPAGQTTIEDYHSAAFDHQINQTIGTQQASASIAKTTNQSNDTDDGGSIFRGETDPRGLVGGSSTSGSANNGILGGNDELGRSISSGGGINGATGSNNQSGGISINNEVPGGNQETGRGLVVGTSTNGSDDTDFGSSNANHYDQVVNGNVTGGLPIVLDLDGSGIEITELSQSTIFMDAGGDGLQHRMAWAAAGNGVLYFDADGSDTINDSREFIFTEWDPTAADDMAALRSKFDLDGDGKLSGTELDGFKVMVTQDDGSLVSRTLAELGITEINLVPDAVQIELPDASMITGQAKFTMGGVEHTVANLTLAAEVQGYRVEESVSNGGGIRTHTQTGFDAAGAIAFAVITESNAEGSRITHRWDDDGDGVVDRVQTINTDPASQNGFTEVVTVSNYEGSDQASWVLINREQTWSNDDQSEVLIERDQTGGDWNSETETRNELSDGRLSINVRQLSEGGDELHRVNTIVSADGLTRNEYTYVDGNSGWESRVLTSIVVQTANRRIDTKTFDSDGTQLTYVREYLSHDGLSRERYESLDGDGTWERIEEHTITVGVDGSRTAVEEVRNGDQTARSETTHVTSADGLTKTTEVRLDRDHDGDLDVVSNRSEITQIASDEERITDIHMTYADGSTGLRSRTILDGDKIGLQVFRDLDLGGGNGFLATDLVRDVRLNGTDRIDEEWGRNADGSVHSRSLETTSQDGKSITLQQDFDGDGGWDLTTTDVTTFPGYARREINVSSENSSLLQRTVIDRSNDGLQTTTTVDTDGDGAWDGRTKVVQADVNGASVTTTETQAGNLSTLLSRQVMTESADRLTRTTETDANGDGVLDSRVETNQSANGDTTTASERLVLDGSETAVSRTTTFTAGDGLKTTVSEDANADGVVETETETTREYLANGDILDRTEVRSGVDAAGANDGRLTSLSETLTERDAQRVTTSTDVDGDGDFDRIEETTTSYEATGRTDVDTEVRAGDGTTVLGRTSSRQAGDGLESWVYEDRDGSGGYDMLTHTRTEIAANGDRTVTETYREHLGDERRETVTTTSGNGRLVVAETSYFGNSTVDERRTDELALDGTRTVLQESLDTDGSVQSQSKTETSDTGLETTTSVDADGDGDFERVTQSTTALNANGSRTQTVEERGPAAGLIGRTVTTTSFDGREVDTTQDLDGDGVVDRTTDSNSTLKLNGDLEEDTTIRAENNDIISKTTRVLSADGQTETLTSDANGDGLFDQRTDIHRGDNGVVTSETVFRGEAGGLLARLKSSTTADGLKTVSQADLDGDGRFDRTITTSTNLGRDGSVTETIEIVDERSLLLGEQITTTNHTGLEVRTERDTDGDGVHERVSVSEMTYADDGQTTTYRVTYDEHGGETFEETTIVAGNGLFRSIVTDFDGDNAPDRVLEYTEDRHGGTVETTREFGFGASLQAEVTITSSADGRERTIEADWDGDGYQDYGLTEFVQANRDTIATYTELALDGMIESTITARMDANGFAADYHFDISSNGQVQISREETRYFLGADPDIEFERDPATALDNLDLDFGDGASVRTLIERYGPTTVTYRETETTSANGLVSLTAYDMDGDGEIDGNTLRMREYLEDGGMRDSVEIRYADGELRYTSETITSADGREILTTTDNDGNGVADQETRTVIAADGARTEYVSNFNAGGYNLGTSITETSADGLTTVVTRNGVRETTERSEIEQRSYTWFNGVETPEEDNESLTVTHLVDAFGVDTWTMVEADGPAASDETTYQVRLDEAAKAKIFGDAARLYDTLLDRDMSTEERETLVKFVADGQLDQRALAEHIIDDTEFVDRYGNVPRVITRPLNPVPGEDPPVTQSEAGFVYQLFMNALGRPPSLNELAERLDALETGDPRSNAVDLALALSASTEHRVVGNGHLATNNFDTITNPIQFERQLDRDTVEDTVRRLVDVTYDRDATDHEVEFYAQLLLEGTTLPRDIVEMLLSADGGIHGVETNSLAGETGNSLVIQGFRNALSRHPSESELYDWAGLLGGNLQPADFIAALAMSADHKATGYDHLTNTVPGNQQSLLGGSGSDDLIGGAGADRLAGGAGADTLRGEEGSDTYLWTPGNGHDFIIDGASHSEVEGASSTLFDTDHLILIGVNPNDVSMIRYLGTNNLDIIVSGSRLTVEGQFDNLYRGNGIETIEFADGTIWTIEDIVENTVVNGDASANDLGRRLYGEEIRGFGGGDTLKGSPGDDTLVGGAGADTLWGNDGSDTYVWERGDGSDTIEDQFSNIPTDDTSASVQTGLSRDDVDVLKLTDVVSAQVTLRRSISTPEELQIVIAGSAGGTITVNDQFVAYDGRGIEGIEFSDGERWDLNEILARTELRGSGSSNSIAGSNYDDRILGFAGSDRLYGGYGRDTLEGGVSDDTLYGGDGADTYVWSFGDGIDRIHDTGDFESEFDTLELRGVNSTDGVRLWQNAGHLYVEVNDGGTAVIAAISENFYTDSNVGIDRILFADGEVWNREEILARAEDGGTSGNDTMIGTAVRDNLDGFSGNDALYGLAGDDWLVGGRGNDTLDGGDGSDVYEWWLRNDGTGPNHGNDIIIDAGADAGDIDTLRLIGVDEGSISVSKSANNDDLIIAVDGAQITLQDRLTGATNSVENLVFDSGSVVELLGDEAAYNTFTGSAANDSLPGTIFRDLMFGGDGADTLFGGGQEDTLYGGLGDDRLVGGAGDDTYHWTVGAGIDRIAENTTGAGVDTLHIHGTDWSLIEFRRASGSNDLRILYDDADAVILEGMFAPAPGGNGEQRTVIDRVVLDDGSYLTIGEILDQVRTYGNSNNNLINGSAFDDYIVAGDGDDTLYGGDGEDVLIGQRGNDTMAGGKGNDEYHWTYGDGNDRIEETIAGEAGTDRLKFLNNVQEDVTLTRQNGSTDLVITVSGGSSSDQLILLADQFGDPEDTLPGVEFIEFADGEIWSVQDIWAQTRVQGGAGTDVMNGSAVGDRLEGNGGADTLRGNAGDDTLMGGNGNDLLEGGVGSDLYYWTVTAGNDTLDDDGLSALEVDTLKLQGASLDDLTFHRSHGSETLVVDYTPGGGAVQSTLWIRQQYENDATAGNDQLTPRGIERLVLDDGTVLTRSEIEAITTTSGNAQNNEINGRSGIDRIRGAEGDDVVRGGYGDDWLFGGDGADSIVGGYGTDIASYREAHTGVQVTIGTAAQTGTASQEQTGDTFHSIEGLEGSYHNDLLQGDAGFNILLGGAGDDDLRGHDGSDDLDGGAGTDSVYGGVGSDTVDGGEGADSLYGGIGHDTFVVDDVGDLIFDNASQGTADVVMSSVSYVLVQPGSVANIEVLMTTDALGTDNISLTGNELAQTIIGNAGQNTLDSASGGGDTLQGGEGDDTYLVRNASDLVVEDAGHGFDVVRAFTSYALDALASVEVLETNYAAGIHNRSLTGNDFVQTIHGNAGNNTIDGMGGADTLNGAAGADQLTGGAGHDVFQYLAQGHSGNSAGTRDVITDFELGVDTIDLWAIDADTATAGDQTFTFLGVTADHSGAGSIKLQQNGNDTIVWVSTDADIYSEMSILLEGIDAQQLTVDDFRLRAPGIEATIEAAVPSDPEIYDANVHNLEQGSTTALETVTGTSGVDWIEGGDGRDVVIGGGDRDQLFGGFGNDIFAYEAVADSTVAEQHRDVIRDFVIGQDRIDLSALDGDTTAVGDQGFTFLGNTSAHVGTGTIRYTFGGGSTFVWVNTDDGSSSEMGIEILGTHALTEADFILPVGQPSGSPGGSLPGTHTFVQADYNPIESTTESNDTLNGQSGADWIIGGDGKDWIYGGDGDDYILPGTGSDRDVYGGAGVDVFAVGPQDDVIHIWDWEDGVDKIHLIDGLEYSDFVWGSYGDYVRADANTDSDSAFDIRLFFRNTAVGTITEDDFITGAGTPPGGGGTPPPPSDPYVPSNYDVEWVSQTTERDNYTAPNGQNVWMDGGAGRDDITGGDGDDYIIAGTGTDFTIRGGLGADVFQINADSQTVQIHDWEEGIDKLRLMDGLDWQNDFQERLASNGKLYFEADLDGDNTYELKVVFATNIPTLDATDFV